MLNSNTQLMIGAVSMAFALGLATSRVNSSTASDVVMAKGSREPSYSASAQKNFEYFPAQFVNQGKGVEAPIQQF